LNPIFIEANVNPSLGGSQAAFDNHNKRLLMKEFFDLVGIRTFEFGEYKKRLGQGILGWLEQHHETHRNLFDGAANNPDFLRGISELEYEV